MLDTDPNKWHERVRNAEQLRDDVVYNQTLMIRQYHGSAYQQGDEPDHKWPENHWYEWLKNIRPQVVYDNPSVSVSTRRGGIDQRVPQALEGVVGWWTESVNLWRELDRVFVDSAFSYGVLMTYYEPYPGFEGRALNDEAVPFRPNARRIAPHRWFCDYDCDNYAEARYAGHVWRADKEELEEDERFDSAVVRELVSGAGHNDKWRAPQSSHYRRHSGNSDDEVICYDIWVPELGELFNDEDANGAILTMGVTFSSNGKPNEPAWIREPRPYYGPRWGPYTLFGYNIVPNNPYPLAPFVAVYEQIQSLNEHATALARSAARQKRIIGVDSSQPDTVDTIQNAEDGEVVVVNQLGENVQEMSLGGAEQSQYQHVQWLRDLRDRVTGLTETSRGNVSDDATATAISEAASQEETRIAMLKRLFAQSTEQTLHTAAYYYFHEPNAIASLPEDIAKQFAPRPTLMPDENQASMMAMRTGMSEHRVRRALSWQPEVIFAGGEADEVLTRVNSGGHYPRFVVAANIEGIEYEDLTLEIEPYSMERTNEALLQKQRMELVDRVANLAPLMAKAPQLLRYDKLFDLLGEALNERELSDRLIPQQMLEQIKQADNNEQQQAVMQQIMAQLQQQGGQAQQPAATANQPQPAQAAAQDMGQLLGQANGAM